ncbi:MAG TPA: aspartyl/asparaginyl beta-hydroxylase domain-containing protein [Sphingomicrobium sp.]|nr:aspartyl/asparaginyl beta-hydroxylase domain-containing protein [Sphingomicrobium sp.]
MTGTASSLEAAVREGELAMRRRDPSVARRHFQEAIEAGYRPAPWLPLARACRALGDRQAEEAAVDQALAVDTRDIRGLVMKGDCLAARGRERDAVIYYQAAIRTGKETMGLSHEVESDLSRARAADMKLRNKFEDYLYQRLDEAGFGQGARSRELEQSLDILMGRRSITIESDAEYVQEPTSFFYPGLPQRQFYERSEFAWASLIEAAADEIRAELEAVLADDDAFRPYVVQHPDQPINHHVLMNDPSWSAFYLMRDGQPVRANAPRCPRTLEVLRQAPLPHIAGRAPNILFSLLRPGTHIPAHSGIVNTQLICHLPLIVPPGCELRVGNEIRTWEEGKLLVFDDSIEHEAWNRSDQTRVVLLFEIWRPEIVGKERDALTLLFESVEQYGPSDKGMES